MKAAREIIEFSPNQYISMKRLESGGITIADLEDYCNAINSHVKIKEYFTITSLRKDGFSHHLDDLGFDEWFYASLLVEDHVHFFHRRMGGTKLFCKGEKNVSLIGFLCWLVEREIRIDIYDLEERLEQQYGIVLSKDKLITVIRDSELYYDDIMEAVYKDEYQNGGSTGTGCGTQ